MDVQKPIFRRMLSVFVACAVAAASAGWMMPSTVQAEETVEQMQESIDELQKKQEELQKQIASVDGSIADETAKQKQYEEQIANVEKQLELYQQQIDAVNNSIAVKNNEIADKNDEILQKTRELHETDLAFQERLDAMYIYSEHFSPISMLFGSDSFADFLTNMELIKEITQHDQDLLDLLDTQKQQMQELKSELQTKKAELETQKNELTAIEQSYQDKSKELTQLKQDSEAQTEKLQMLRDQLWRDSKEAKAEEEKILKAIEEAKAQQAAQAQTPSSGSPSSAGYLWPCPSCQTITSYYGNRWGTVHGGIDIGAAHGASIVASRGGTVIIAQTGCTHDYGKDGSCGCGGGYGNYVMIDHGDGYQTLYGHCSSLNVTAGQTVAAGDVIGFVGSTGYSTGNHLHFEIRQNGTRVDPMGYLS